MELEKVTLEDNKEYYIIDTILVDNVNYLFLSEKLNSHTSIIRKLSKNGKEVVGLESEAEYHKALSLFTEKYKDIFC